MPQKGDLHGNHAYAYYVLEKELNVHILGSTVCAQWQSYLKHHDSNYTEIEYCTLQNEYTFKSFWLVHNTHAIIQV